MLDRMISLADAAKQLNMSMDFLRNLIDDGKVRAALLSDGSIVVSEKFVNKQSKLKIKKSDHKIAVRKNEELDLSVTKEELSEYKNHQNLRGVTISVREAARKYAVTLSTLQRWINKGFINKIGSVKIRVLVDEADVAYCVDIYTRMHGKRGSWVFNVDGTPYIRKQQNSFSSSI
jgi:hypothetical protein